MRKIMLIIGISFANYITYAQCTDTLRAPENEIYQHLYSKGTFSASYIHEQNWNNTSYNAISLLGNIDLRNSLVFPSGNSHYHTLLTEVSYLRMSDSVWIKSSDYIKLEMQWNVAKQKYFQQNYSVCFNTQWLNTWKQNLTETGYRKTWNGGFLNPADLQIAYGVSRKFLSNSRITLSYATARISTSPRNANDPDILKEADKSLFITTHSYIRSEYGFSAILNMFEPLYGDVVRDENNSRLFFNALDKTGLHLDLNNRIIICFLKYMQLRFDTRIVYNPDISTHLQYRQEVLLGVFYQHRNQWAQH